jgi:hypothetical protein
MSSDVRLEAKIVLPSDNTIDLTANPDCGQVAADPSPDHHTAYELYFREQRPFFIEGNNTLNFPIAFDNNNLFYSRRIGRPPQSGPVTDINSDDGVNEYIKPNGRTTILGAAKLTGKNKKGFSWGLLESVTSREYSEIDSLGNKRTQITEPSTNYFVMRAQQDINKGNTLIGGMFTATNRKLDDARLEWLHKNAYSGGIDFVHHWKKREYYISTKFLMSHVEGSKESISNTQLSSERFFQRPDNHHTEFDPNRKSLTGTGGQFIVGKKSGNLVSDLGVTWQSPELELNDIGFLPQTDNISQWFWMQYRILKPKGNTRSQRFNINQWHEWDFGGRSLSSGYNINAHAEFKNLWESGGGITYRSFRASNADLRGGPTIEYPGMLYYWGYVGTDSRKKFYVMLNPEYGVGMKNYSREFYLNFRMTFRPFNALNISFAPTYSTNKNEMQYVETADANGQPRYVVGRIDQTTIRLVMRATYMLTPNLSIQYYGQPFGTSGHYSKFKSITNASASEYASRFMPLSPTSINNTYWIDENNDGTQDYSFGRPDFNFGQFRSNMVMRWEYIPGSTFFLVWTRERNGAFYDSHPEHKDYSFNFDQKGHNIFLLKFTLT